MSRILLALALLVPAPLVAQISTKIDLVAWGEDIHGLTLGSPEKERCVTALGFRYSEPVSYSGPVTVKIFQNLAAVAEADAAMRAQVEEANKNQEGRPVKVVPLPQRAAPPAGKPGEAPPPVALAMIPAGSRRVTILLAPAANGTFRTYVIDDDPTKLPFGRLRVHNLSPLVIALRCNGGQPAEIKPQQTLVVQPQANRQVVYELAYQHEGRWKIQENNLVKIVSDEQAQMVILKSNDAFFTSSDGSTGGFLQSVVLRRPRESAPAAP